MRQNRSNISAKDQTSVSENSQAIPKEKSVSSLSSIPSQSSKGNEERNTWVKNQLKNTLLKMLKTRRIDEIPIAGLCEAAMVGRASFYRNFSSKEDILAQILKDRLALWQEQLNQKETARQSESASWKTEGNNIAADTVKTSHNSPDEADKAPESFLKTADKATEPFINTADIAEEPFSSTVDKTAEPFAKEADQNEGFQIFMLELFAHLQENRDFYQTLYQQNCLDLLKQELFDRLHIDPQGEMAAAYSGAFVVYLLFGFIEIWIQRGMKDRPEDLTRLFMESSIRQTS